MFFGGLPSWCVIDHRITRRVARGSELTHVDVGPLPSTLYDPRYVAFCEETLGAASERALGQAADAIARAITSYEQYAVLQRLASLFDSATEALAAVESGASAALETYCARVASGRALLEIVVGELSHWSRLPPLPLDAEHLSHLERARLEAPGCAPFSPAEGRARRG